MFQSLKSSITNMPEYGTQQNNPFMDFFRGQNADMNKMKLMGAGAILKGESGTPYAQQLQGMRETQAQNAALDEAVGGAGLSEMQRKLMMALPQSQRAGFVLNHLQQQEKQRAAAAAANAKKAEEAANLERMRSLFAPETQEVRLDGVEGNPADIATGYGRGVSQDVLMNQPLTPSIVANRILSSPSLMMDSNVMGALGKFNDLYQMTQPETTEPQEFELKEINGQLMYVDPTGQMDARPVVDGPPPTPEIDVKGEGDLRTEFQGQSVYKDFLKIDDAFDKVQASAGSSNAAGDLSLIFGFMKMLDPGSTVREGEFANAQNATGVSGRIRNLYNRAAEGERLSEEQRKQFLAEAMNLYNAQVGNLNSLGKRYRSYADQYGFDPNRIFTPIELAQMQQETPPPAPTISDNASPYLEGN